MKRLLSLAALMTVCLAYTFLGWQLSQATIRHDHQVHRIVTQHNGERWECR